MTSILQLEANRQNAKHSTGPLSSEGKNISSLNSLKHGIFAKDLLAQENEDAALSYQELKEGIFESLQPRNQLQATLAEKIAVDFWRLRKVLRFEAGAAEQEQQALNQPESHCSPYLENCIKIKIKGLQDELTGIEKALAEVSKKTFQLKKAGEQLLNVIYDAAYALYSRSMTTEDACRLSDREMSLDELFERVKLTEPQFIEEVNGDFKQSIPRLQHSIKEAEEELEDFYCSREAARAVAVLPSAENADKLLKYERSIQRSILQNIAIIHKLQGVL